jgi:putative endonuclease
MFYVYVLKSVVASKSYVGVTNNTTRRLAEHNLGFNYFTKRYTPWEIVHIENFNNFTEARNREKHLKSTSGRRFLKTVFENLRCK